MATAGYPNYRVIGSPSVPSAPPVSGWYKLPDGKFAVTPAFMAMANSPKFIAAEKVCNPLMPEEPMSPAQLALATAQGRKFSKCARAHGMPDFPDPDNQGMIDLQAAGINDDTPDFQHVKKACQSLIKDGVVFYVGNGG